MTSDLTPHPVAPASAVRDIAEGDVAAIRAAYYADGVIGPTEAGEIVRIDIAARSRVPAWTAFYVEALADFIVDQQAPAGYVSEDNASWLIDRLSVDGAPVTDSARELLVDVMARALSVPPRLSAFVLRTVARAVTDGKDRPAVGRDDVERLRRVLFAAGHEGSVGISREEAEVLFDLNDRTAEADNDPAWSDLFVKAIANFLMAARGYTVPSRAEALRREAWLDAPSRGVSALFGDMLSSLLANGLRGVWAAARRDEDDLAADNRARLEAKRQAEAVTSTEVRWLADRIGRDGVIHENERALLKFLSEESPDIHPSLRTLLDTAA
jgi:hypothetical protein